jgi:hypothetical protein
MLKEKVYDFVKGLIYENDEPSLTRVIAIVSEAVFLGVVIYLVVTGLSWSHFDTLAYVAGGGGLGTQVTNKFINSKFNSASGSYEQHTTTNTK